MMLSIALQAIRTPEHSLRSTAVSYQGYSQKFKQMIISLSYCFLVPDWVYLPVMSPNKLRKHPYKCKV